MKINKLYLVIATLLLAGVLGASAANTIYIKDFAIMPGETKIVEMYVESTREVRSFQTDIQLPDGLSIDCDKVMLSDRSNQHIVYADSTGTNCYTIMAFSLSNTPFTGVDGTMVEIPITATETFARSASIELKGILIEASDKTVLIIDGASSCNAFIARPISTANDTVEPNE